MQMDSDILLCDVIGSINKLGLYFVFISTALTTEASTGLFLKDKPFCTVTSHEEKAACQILFLYETLNATFG